MKTKHIVLLFSFLATVISSCNMNFDTPNATPTVEEKNIPSSSLGDDKQIFTDSVTGLSFVMPSSWIVYKHDPGRFIIFQSFVTSEDAMIFGGTKCDLGIDTDPPDELEKLLSDFEEHNRTSPDKPEIVSEESVKLNDFDASPIFVVNEPMLGTKVRFFFANDNLSASIACYFSGDLEASPYRDVMSSFFMK